jgi:hypothetical protein
MKKRWLWWLSVVVVLVAGRTAIRAQESKVQILSGRLEQGSFALYTLAGLEAADSLYVYATGSSGNLDPFVALLDARVDLAALSATYLDEVDQAIAKGEDPFRVIPRISDATFAAWNDDGGTGHDAALSYAVPADGDYYLLLLSSPSQRTFGDYQLSVGINAPQVLSGMAAVPSGTAFVQLDTVASGTNVGVQEVQGEITEVKRSTFFDLEPVEAGDTLSIYFAATDGDLRPIVYLEDFGGKRFAGANVDGQSDVASLEYTFDAPAAGYRIAIDGCCAEGPQTTGAYRLLVGLNEPAVLSGEAAPGGRRLVRAPIPVAVGIKLQQITGVDQKAENYGAVASMQMEWVDAALAFRPDECNCREKVYTDSNFNQFLVDVNNRWPTFTLYNQQGNRWTQNRAAVIYPDGRAFYLERFSTTFQAPDFDFRLFPFDRQQFFIRVDSLYPVETYTFTDLEGFTDVGAQLGEEEWLVTDFDTRVSNEVVSTGNVTSRFSFGFEARRHLDYYIFRILLPILVIVLVSWITFFLRSYEKRIDIASGNLLLFIAFNFTISGELPRLGYLTLLDTILIGTFVITALVVIFNVMLKRLELAGRAESAERIDRNTIWLYPLAYVIGLGVIILFFG